MIHQKGFQEEIIIFTRYPLPGKAKTRLIPALGIKGAANLQRTMTEQTVCKVRKVANDSKRNLAVYYTNGSNQQMKQWLGAGISYHEQEGKDLGQRLHNAFLDSWERGNHRTVIIGSDCPAINNQLIDQALVALDSNQLVLGPSTDGGYYLIGTLSDLPADTLTPLLQDIPWGTSGVFQETINKADNYCVTAKILEELQDIDTPRDLTYFDHHSNAQ